MIQKQRNIAVEGSKKYCDADCFFVKSHSNNFSLLLFGAMQAM